MPHPMVTEANSRCDLCGCETAPEYLTATVSREFPMLCPECWQEWADYCSVSA